MSLTVADILAAPTGAAWVEGACEHWRALLIDHANCEKKAASSALALIFAYPDDLALSSAASRLAREELRHFEQVSQLLQRLGVPFERQKPGRYATRLRAALHTHEPLRKLDLLLSNALIEARSCERFGLLAPRLTEPLGSFYGTLARSEARHFALYLKLAAAASNSEGGWRPRLRHLAELEAQLVTSPDELLRFHSGPVRAAAVPV
ncbi:MAG: tRNA isopentenyl-2-thiomethyl-A-37 hydroxylase MiaE [Steroidobacteraceae bacterium]